MAHGTAQRLMSDIANDLLAGIAVGDYRSTSDGD